jgi:hypothetical protein
MHLVPKTRIKSVVIGDMAKVVEICDGVPGEPKVVFLKPLHGMQQLKRVSEQRQGAS